MQEYQPLFFSTLTSRWETIHKYTCSACNKQKRSQIAVIWDEITNCTIIFIKPVK